jgi:hypothetical protein
LAEIYAVRHDHTHWEDHKLRVSVTTQVARWMVSDYTDVVADLSCGDGAIANGVPALRHILGDMAEGVELVGPIEATVRLIPKVNLFISCRLLQRPERGALLGVGPRGRREDARRRRLPGLDLP